MKKPVTKKAVEKDEKELTERLGPSRKVVKTSKAEGTENSVVLHLECGHKRVATKRATLRCRKCRKGAKPAAAKKQPVKVAAKKETEKKAAKKATVVNVQKQGKPKITREPVSEPVAPVVEKVAQAMDRKRSLRRRAR